MGCQNQVSAQHDAGDVDVDDDAQDVDNPGDEWVAHHGWVQADLFEYDRQDCAKHASNHDHGNQCQRNDDGAGNAGRDERGYNKTKDRQESPEDQ